MSHDPNPYNPASEYDQVRKSRDDRAKLDKRNQEPPEPTRATIKSDLARHEDTDICPEREDDGYCKVSRRDRPQDPFLCTSGKSFKGCTIYIRERKRKRSAM